MKVKNNKEEKNNDKKFELIRKFKKTWLAKGINTVFLIAILMAIFILINFGMKKWDPTPIDLTKSQDYTLTEESKNRIKNIDKDVNIYFIGFEEENQDYQLAKQYNKSNSKIKVEVIDANKNVEITKKYNIESGVATVVVESGKKNRILSEYDLVNYDYETGGSVDIAEQKITSAIINVTAEKMPKAYFLTGYTDFSLDEEGYLSGFAQYLENEVLTYESLNILSKQKVPDDCDTLIIMTPSKDFDDLTTKAIIDYIKKGGNILWFNGIYTTDVDYKNVEKVLSQYGVKKFEKGMIYETDASKIFGYSTCFAPDIEENSILKDVKKSAGTVFFNATKINVDTEKLEALKVEKEDLLVASDKSRFATDVSKNPDEKNDEKGSFIVGAKFEKTVGENKKENNEGENSIKSTLILYANDYFISDYPVQMEEYEQPIYSLFNNKDVALNSLAYLTNNDEEITIRKSYSDSQTSFTPSDKEKRIIIAIIFAVPVAVIITGIIVWVIRKRKNK